MTGPLEFFPKIMAFEPIATKDIEFAMHCLNPRPRKFLGYITSRKVLMNKIFVSHNSVSLQS